MRHPFHYLRAIACCAVIFSVVSPSILHGEDAPSTIAEGTSSISLEQKGTTLGALTLLDPHQESHPSKAVTLTYSNITAGKYTLFITQPAGTTTHVDISNGSTVTQSSDSPQITFDLPDGASFHITITYTLTLFGTIGISTTPQGIPFELRGPNEFIKKDVSPQSYDHMPIGLYSITYTTPGCTTPAQKSQQVDNAAHVYFSLNMKCDTLQLPASSSSSSASVHASSSEPSSSRSSASQASSSATSSLSSASQASSISSAPPPSSSSAASVSSPSLLSADALVTLANLYDVPRNAWYAPFVARTAANGILSGYKDPFGRPIGKFGPTNPVLMVELAKMAQKLAKIDTDFSAIPSNVRARNGWFSGYMAMAEKLNWAVYQDEHLDPQRPATRAEVVMTLAQALGIQSGNATGTLFSDVKADTPYAAEIEAAAQMGFITGKKNPDGTVVGFDPYGDVTRAEMAAIISRLLDQQH